MIYGYCRISTKKQSIDRQVRNILREYPRAKIYEEAFTGTKIDRPEWNKLQKRLVPGDVVVFDEVSRMSRNAEEGFQLYKQLFRENINLVFLKEPYINTNSYRESMNGVCMLEVDSGDVATDELINTIMAALNRFMMNKVETDIRQAFDQAQKEVDYLHERTKEGLREAKEKGKHIGLRKGTKLRNPKEIEAKTKMWKHCKDFGGTLTDAECMDMVKVCRNTYYKYKRELKLYGPMEDGKQESVSLPENKEKENLK